MQYKPYKHQAFNTQHIIDNNAAGCMLTMGLGKTVSTLTAVDLLLNYYMRIQKVLIIAPKKVAEIVWPDEIRKWDHLNHLTYSLVAGTAKERKAALMKEAQLYIVSVDNVAWLVALYGGGKLPFDMLIVDESSMFKNHQSQRFGALKQIRPLIDKVVILTGTPSPNGLIDLWAQIYILDRGARLGSTITAYRERFFYPAKVNGFTVYKYEPQEGAKEKIYGLIGDICISMSGKDYLDLPEVIYNYIPVQLDQKTYSAYEDFEYTQLYTIAQTGTEISPVNAAALNNKLTQFANGALYDEDKVWHPVHNEKIEALKEIVATSQGKSLLVLYWYQSDLERLKQAFPHAVQLKGRKEVEQWNNGQIEMGLMHPASGGHGLNLQDGGHIGVWFGLTWDLQLYQQACARLPRPGQKEQVIWHHLIAKGTIDEDIMKALKLKDAGQNALMEAIKARFEKYSIKIEENIW